ncbi:hypothetical protein ACVDG5_005365 [Mesorhizobium sp. ORM6]
MLLMSGKAAAGWYHVENYEGTIGSQSVHVSLQTYDSFGSGITVEGSYFYDAKQSPIAVYGKLNGTKLALCEISGKKEFERILVMGSKTPVDTAGCQFSLDIAESGATGTWSKGADTYPVTLRKVASLDDTGDTKIDGPVEIPSGLRQPPTGLPVFMRTPIQALAWRRCGSSRRAVARSSRRSPSTTMVATQAC